MKNFLIALIVVVMAGECFAINAYTTRDVRDPVKLKARLDADFATVAAGVGVEAVTNASLTISRAAITATPSYTYATNILTYLDATTNTVSWTNVAISGVSVAIVNGGVTVTNVTITLQKN